MDALTYYELFYSDFFRYMEKRKIYVSDKQKRSLGDAWMEMLHEFVGKLVCDKQKGSGINNIYGEMCSMYPHLFSEDVINEDDQLIIVFDTLRYARRLRRTSPGGEIEQ